MLENHDSSLNKSDIVLTTLDSVPGYDIEQHIGLVNGCSVKITNPLKSFKTKIKMIFGGEDYDFADQLNQARQLAVSNMVEEAKRMSANLIISIRFENASIRPGFIEVYVYGTAVKAAKF